MQFKLKYKQFNVLQLFNICPYDLVSTEKK